MDEEEQRIFDSILEKLKDNFDLSIGERSKLINKYYNGIVNVSRTCIYELIKHSQNKGVNEEVRLLIANKYNKELMVKDYFEKYMKQFQNNVEFSSIFLESSLRDNFYLYNSDVLIKILTKMSDSSQVEIVNKTKEYDKKLTEVYSKSVNEDLKGTIDDQIFYLYHPFFEKWKLYLMDKKSEQVHVLEKYESTVSNKFDIVIQKYGIEIIDSIDVSENMEMIRNEIEISGSIIIYEFTHDLESKRNYSIYKSLSKVEESKTDIAFDLSRQGNVFFKRQREQYLKKIQFLISHIFSYFVNEKVKLLSESLTNYAIYFDENYAIDEKYIISTDMSVLIKMIYEVSEKSVNTDSNEAEYIPLFYGPTMFICGLIEKILRNYYLFCRKDIDYTETKNISLNSLLDEKKDEIVELLGKEQIHVLRYYLILDDGLGVNIRNRLAHLDGLTNPKEFYELFTTTFVLLCSVLSSMILYQVED